MIDLWIALVTALVAGSTPSHRGPTTVDVRLTEWKVELSSRDIPAGPVTFHVTNAGGVPHAFEVEGKGLEKETAEIEPGGAATLTVTLRAGSYEAYCPVGNDSHKRLGMVTRFSVGAASGYGGAGMTDQGAMGAMGSAQATARAIRVAGGGAVIQILPGPFPFADSAAAVIRRRPADQQAELTAKAAHGPYSNNVAPVRGTLTFTAWDLGPTRDSVAGAAEVTTVDGARWRVVLDSVQTRDIPDNPRFGGVILGLYYHGASGVHTPLVPTIQSDVALWAWAHLYRNDALVSDHAPVHIMLLSRTRRPGDWALACWDCARNPVEELQLQVTAPAGAAPLDLPGGFLFVNWEHSGGTALQAGGR